MTKAEILFEIGKVCPGFADEILAILKRLDKEGNFHGPAKEANEKRFAKLCRDALETGEFTREVWSELKRIESTLTGPGRPAIPESEKRKARSVKMSDEEWEEIRGKADKLGLPISEYIRLKTLVE